MSEPPISPISPIGSPAGDAPHGSHEALLKTPLYNLHLERGARMVPFAGYSMPVQYRPGLMAEHLHTRERAGLFDVSHMGQLRLLGPEAAAAFESLMPVDVIDLPVGRQRYGLLLNEEGGILDDLMFIKRSAEDIAVVVNGACKAADLAHIQARIGARCQVVSEPDRALLALQGPLACQALAALLPGVERLVFMTGADFYWKGQRLGVTRSGYTGEDGFEISLPSACAEAFARDLLAQDGVWPIGLGARNALRLEAGMCLYGNDIDDLTTPVEADLSWAIQKVRRKGGAREGGFLGAARVLAQLEAARLEASDSKAESVPAGLVGLNRRRVGLKALERVPVREHTELQTPAGETVGEVTSGLLSPSLNLPIALAYVRADCAAVGGVLHALVRGKPVPMQVVALPFVPHRYWRGLAL